MDDIITVEFTPEVCDRTDAKLYAYHRSVAAPIRFLLEYGAAALAAVVTAAAYLTGATGIFVTVIGITLATVLAAIGPRLAEAIACSRLTPHEAVDQPSRLTFSPGGMTFHSKWGDSRFSWFHVADVVATGRATIIDLDEAGTCVVPARAFRSFDEYRTFAGVLQTWHFEARGSGPPAAMRV